MKPLLLTLMLLIATRIGSEWLPTKYGTRSTPMVWVDGRFRYDDPIEVDTLFDRVVSVAYDDNSGKYTNFLYASMGVLITDVLILTSFNAFRKVSTMEDSLNRMEAYWIFGRTLDESGRTLSYRYRNERHKKIKCARQVIPSQAYENRPIHMQHGIHSPLHDLMVMRLENPANFVTPEPPLEYDFTDYKTNWLFDEKLNAYRKDGFGAIKTILAEPADKLVPGEMKFASLGHIDEKHIDTNSWLEKGKFGEIADCDEWFPKEWGRLICLQNTEDYSGLANGAVLFSGTKLFGVGAFMLKKGKSSILVFTDVRPYRDLLYRTCTEDDQHLRAPGNL